MDDRQFMQQALDCQRKLYRVALSMLRCDADAADAIQEAVFKGWLHRGALRDGERFEAWLTRILVNECRNIQRRWKRRGEPLDEARAMVDRLPGACRRHRPATVLLGYGMAPAFFCPLFGGGFWDAVSAFFCGLAVGACLLFGGKWLGGNGFLRTLVCSGVASLLSLLLVRAGLGSNVDLVTIGVLMLLVPGVALTNAMRELVAGDTYSGLSRTAEAILIAMGIALGSAVGLGIGYIL